MRNRRNMSYERHNCPSVIGRRKYENSWKTNFTSNYVGGGTRNSQVFHLYELTEGTFPLEQGWVLAVWMSNKWTRKLKNSYHWLQFVWLCLPLPICSCIKKNPSVNVLLQKPLFTNFQLITPQQGPCVYTGQEGESYIGEKIYRSYDWAQVVSQRQTQVPYTMFHWKKLHLYRYIHVQRLGIGKNQHSCKYSKHDSRELKWEVKVDHLMSPFGRVTQRSWTLTAACG